MPLGHRDGRVLYPMETPSRRTQSAVSADFYCIHEVDRDIS